MKETKAATVIPAVDATLKIRVVLISRGYSRIAGKGQREEWPTRSGVQ
jgi:hypothetical protein